MERITLTRALSEIKLLDKRIADKLSQSQFVTLKVGNNKKTINGVIIEEFNTYAKSELQSIEDLITRRTLLKSKLAEANGKSRVKVGEKEYFISEAIEKKNSINLEINLLNTLVKQLNATNQTMQQRNNKMESDLNQLLNTKVANEKSKDDDTLAFSKSYREMNETLIVDSLNLRAKVEKLGNDIHEFQNNVDFALSEINATTHIEI